MSLFARKTPPEVSLQEPDALGITAQQVEDALHAAFSGDSAECLGDVRIAVDGRTATVAGVDVSGGTAVLFEPLGRLLLALDADIDSVTPSVIVLTVRA